MTEILEPNIKSSKCLSVSYKPTKNDSALSQLFKHIFVRICLDFVVPSLSWTEAAGVPEAFLTAFQLLFVVGQLRAVRRMILPMRNTANSVVTTNHFKLQQSKIYTQQALHNQPQPSFVREPERTEHLNSIRT
jgi:hypothetical protein